MKYYKASVNLNLNGQIKFKSKPSLTRQIPPFTDLTKTAFKFITKSKTKKKQTHKLDYFFLKAFLYCGL
jgi:hypothetical protein